MKRGSNPFDQDVLPPFAGFPDDTLAFFRALEKHNDRAWFEEHRTRYDESVREPMLSLLSALAVRVRSIDPDLEIEPKRAMYRIHRDTRFSADKTPYKTHTAAAFSYRGLDRNADAGFYFHIAPKEIGVGGGMYMPDGARLKKIRAGIDREPDALPAILGGKSFRSRFGELQGASLVRIPQGYDRDHPAADLLRRKQLFCWAELDPAIVTTPKFADILMDHFQAMAPLVQWLVRQL
jgi:uncharacterized protein (TIGR02453 family)